jgi:hypothetical protein
MATFVHLAAERDLRSIRRSGLRPGPARGHLPSGVYALPTTPSFAVSHQWLRELKRGGQRTFWGVYFRVHDEEPVWVGHYNGAHREMRAGDAAGLLFRLAQDGGAEGYEVVVPRPVAPEEIHRVRLLPQVVGWRYVPGAHGTRPCGCPVCRQPGTFGARAIRERYEAEERAELERAQARWKRRGRGGA